MQNTNYSNTRQIQNALDLKAAYEVLCKQYLSKDTPVIQAEMKCWNIFYGKDHYQQLQARDTSRGK